MKEERKVAIELIKTLFKKYNLDATDFDQDIGHKMVGEYIAGYQACQKDMRGVLGFEEEEIDYGKPNLRYEYNR